MNVKNLGFKTADIKRCNPLLGANRILEPINEKDMPSRVSNTKLVLVGCS